MGDKRYKVEMYMEPWRSFVMNYLGVIIQFSSCFDLVSVKEKVFNVHILLFTFDCLFLTTHGIN